MPQALVSMVTKKIAGSILSLLVREAQKVSALDAEADASFGLPPADSPYLRKVADGSPFYKHLEFTLQQYFALFGEESPRGDGA
jgi:hypothetical protein